MTTHPEENGLVRQQLRSFIAEELLPARGSTPVADDDELLVSGLLDSLAVVRLVSFIETDLGVPVPPEDVTLDHFQTIDAIVRYLAGRSGS